MLYPSKQLHGRPLGATDGDVGKVVDFFFDDERWTVRYLVVETGSWFNSRQVLISPASLVDGPFVGVSVHADLTREQIRKSPPVDTHQPVSRQYEIEYAAYYGHPEYWLGGGLWGVGALPVRAVAAPAGPDTRAADSDKSASPQATRESHLRSCNEVIGYHIDASDGEIGHVEEFLIDADSWQIRRLQIDTRNWLPGKHVTIEPRHIREIDWPRRLVRVALTRDEVRSAPEVER